MSVAGTPTAVDAAAGGVDDAADDAVDDVVDDAVDDSDTDPEVRPRKLAEPAERGRLHIDDRVVEKVSARAVAEVDRATGAPRTLFGQALGSADKHTPARTSARVDGDVVTVAVSMSVQWPAPIREVAAQVRDQVTNRVQRITGMTVAEVDIDVPTLLTAGTSTSRVR